MMKRPKTSKYQVGLFPDLNEVVYHLETLRL